MPGIYGAVALRSNRDPSDVAGAMRELITHQPWYGHCADRRGGRVIGAVSTNPDFSADTRLAVRDGVRLLIEGTALTVDGDPVPNDAPDFAARLLDLYLAEGDPFVDHVGGHYNLVIDDARDERLILLNDHMGFAQMYWYLDDEIFLFGPELKMCLAWRGVDLEVDKASVATFLAQECPWGKSTLLKRVSTLLEGSRLELRDGRVTSERYWRPTYRPEEDRTPEDFADEAIALYERSVAKRVPARAERVVVPLSGGLDSRLLLAMVRDRGDALQLFTHGQEGCEETRIAREVARALGLEHCHRLVELKPEWYGRHAREAVWLNDGMCNMRNAGLIGVSHEVGPGPAPFLNGILGPYLSVGSGHHIKSGDIRVCDDEEVLRRRVLEFAAVDRGVAAFASYMAPDAAREMADLARGQVWGCVRDYDDVPLMGDRIWLHQTMNMDKRMQTSVDVHKYFFHDLIPMIDGDLFDLFRRIPLRWKPGNPIYKDMYRRHLTGLARIVWSRTGHDLYASEEAIASTIKGRLRRLSRLRKIRRWSLGRINPIDRSQYNHREVWLRRNRIYREEVGSVLGAAAGSGCDFLDPARVGKLWRDFQLGKDWLLHTLMQIYTTIVWHEQFLRAAPRGRDLRPLEE